jgi:hypothetical protein
MASGLAFFTAGLLLQCYYWMEDRYDAARILAICDKQDDKAAIIMNGTDSSTEVYSDDETVRPRKPRDPSWTPRYSQNPAMAQMKRNLAESSMRRIWNESGNEDISKKDGWESQVQTWENDMEEQVDKLTTSCRNDFDLDCACGTVTQQILRL